MPAVCDKCPYRQRARPAAIRLRKTLQELWDKGQFTRGTTNELVLSRVLLELGYSRAAPPYGFKTAETVRKVRHELGMV